METQPTRSALRERAEDFLKKHRDEISLTAPGEIKKLVEELRIHQIELEVQNEELQQAQLEISALRDKFEDLYEFIPVGYFIMDEQKQIREVNLTACRMLGKNRSALKGAYFHTLIDASCQQLFYNSCRSTFGSNLRQNCELKMKKADGHLFWARIESVMVTREDSDPAMMRIAISDISEQKKAEQLIQAALEEKDILLHEIHHRVKNNMMVISSLLDLQSNTTDNEQVRAALRDSQNRVQAMSQIHETLYRSENLAALELDTYLSNLARSVFQSYTRNNKIDIRLDVAHSLISTRQASSIGLIVNELISNSLKYAFPDDRQGSVIIKSKLNPEGDLVLTVSDNGIGIPQDFNPEKTGSLGLKLVKLIAEDQLHGSVRFERDHGTKVTIQFRIET